jgi:hypothetical protein
MIDGKANKSEALGYCRAVAYLRAWLEALRDRFDEPEKRLGVNA